MNQQSYIKPEIDENKAINAIHQHSSGVMMKLFGQKKASLKSIELVYLPFWCYPYHLESASLNGGVEGKLAMEPITGISAILPAEYPLHPIEEGLNCLPLNEPENREAAHKAIYWEAFSKEKQRKSIDVEVHTPWILYMPYWVGYLKGKEYDILCVDAVTGKIDLPIKKAILLQVTTSI